MNKVITCDIAIIGGGAGGLSIAAVASQLGLNVVLAEARRMGGDCLNYGCVPSKALLAAAKRAHAFIDSAKFGIQDTSPVIDFNEVMEHVADVIARIAPNDSVERFTKLGVRVISYPATFINAQTIKAGDYTITAKHVVIATGSSPAIPPVPGLADVPYLTNETIFSLKQKPSHLLVIGAGPIGCEMAQAFCFLQSRVTVFEAFTMMPRDDKSLVGLLRKKLTDDGVEIHEGVKINQVCRKGDAIHVAYEINGEQREITGSHILVAAGRRVNVEGLGLEQAGIAYTAKGIQVDERLRTRNKRVYAIGDVAGSYQFTHIANYHAGIVIRNMLFKWPVRVNYAAIPWVTYTSPPLAHVGMSEDEAKKRYRDVSILSADYSDNDRAIAERETNGQIRVICRKNGKILGVSILGMQADALILPWGLLIQQGKTLRQLTEVIVPYPTFSEISKRVASEFYAPTLFSERVKKLVRWLQFI